MQINGSACSPTAKREKSWEPPGLVVDFSIMRAVVAYHLIITAYGFWLPNDPRGSWSDFVLAWELVRFGKATKTTERRSLARDPHHIRLRLEAKRALARRAVEFDGVQARAVIRGFARYVERSECMMHACSVMPAHAHLVVGRHRYSIEQVATLLKGAATAQLIKEGIHPFRNQAYRNGALPTPWARGEWKVFLSSDEDVRCAVRYVEANPTKERFPKQKWWFVQPLA